MEASDSSSESAAPWATAAQPAAGAPAADAAESDTFAERPELFVGAAFAGGVVLAGVLRWLGSR